MRRTCRAALALSLVLLPTAALWAGAAAPDETSPVPDPAEVARSVDDALAREVFTPAKADLAPRADDETFLRRVWLDIAGSIPPPAAVARFKTDASPDKRATIVRNLLTNPRYGRNWSRYWRDVIMYRRIEDRALLASRALEDDLGAALNDGLGWDRIASDFITARGDVQDNGATALIMAQDARTEETAAEVARIFLGTQIQCAQCHDHPYDRWKRDQFHELAAFFPRLGVRPVQAEGERRSFMVFANDRPPLRRANDNDQNRPMAEHFMPDLEDPTAPGTRMQPVFFLNDDSVPFGVTDAERRQTLAQWLTANEWFAMAAVNRVWAELVGEGFYEPVDDIGPDRTATAPQTLALLANSFRLSGYDLKWLMETICRTDAYQRQSRPRRQPGDGVPFAANVPQPLRADVLYDAVLSALEVQEPQPGGRRGQGMMMAAARNRGPRGQFNETFGYDPSDPRESVAGSIPQVLAMMNSPQVAGQARTFRRGYVWRLASEVRDDSELVRQLYVQVLSREPAADETTIATKYLADVRPRTEAVEDLTWALLNSAEFRHRR